MLAGGAGGCAAGKGQSLQRWLQLPPCRRPPRSAARQVVLQAGLLRLGQGRALGKSKPNSTRDPSPLSGRRERRGPWGRWVGSLSASPRQAAPWAFWRGARLPAATCVHRLPGLRLGPGAVAGTEGLPGDLRQLPALACHPGSSRCAPAAHSSEDSRETPVHRPQRSSGYPRSSGQQCLGQRRSRCTKDLGQEEARAGGCAWKLGGPVLNLSILPDSLSPQPLRPE